MQDGNRIVMSALTDARSGYLDGSMDDFNLGHAFGQICIAGVHMRADYFIAEGARNELHFLRAEQLRRQHATN